MTFAEWLKARGLDEATLTTVQRDAFKRDFDVLVGGAAKPIAVAPVVPHVNEVEAANQRSAAAGLRADLLELAASHSINLGVAKRSDELVACKTVKEGSSLLFRWKAEDEKTATGVRNSTVVEVGVEQVEKINTQACDALLARAGIKGYVNEASKLQGNPFTGRRTVELIRQHARMTGVEGADSFDDQQVAKIGLGTQKRNMGGLRAANLTSAMFGTYVLANVMDVALARGYDNFSNMASYQKWTRTREVTDFKAVTGGAIDVGNLVLTAENAPFPQLEQADVGYSAALDMWGCQDSLTLQTIINDTLGEFLNKVYRAGGIAARTIEKETVRVLENLTMTGGSNTATGAGLGTGTSPTPALLDVARNAFLQKTGPAGQLLGNVPQILLYQATQGVPVGIALGKITYYAGASNGSIPSMSMQGIENIFMTGTATTYWLLADPAICDGIVLLKLQGMDQPQVEEFDSGAVAARSFKFYMPFKPVANQTTVAGTIYTPGILKATV